MALSLEHRAQRVLLPLETSKAFIIIMLKPELTSRQDHQIIMDRICGSMTTNVQSVVPKYQRVSLMKDKSTWIFTLRKNSRKRNLAFVQEPLRQSEGNLILHSRI